MWLERIRHLGSAATKVMVAVGVSESVHFVLESAGRPLTGLLSATVSCLLLVAALIWSYLEYKEFREEIFLEARLRQASRGDASAEQLLAEREGWLLRKLDGLAMQDDDHLLAAGARVAVGKGMKGAQRIVRDGLWMLQGDSARGTVVSAVCGGSDAPLVEALIEGLEHRARWLERPDLWGQVLDALKSLGSDALWVKAVEDLGRSIEGPSVMDYDDAIEYLKEVRPRHGGLKRLEEAARSAEGRKRVFELAASALSEEGSPAAEYRAMAERYQRLADAFASVWEWHRRGGGITP